MTQGCKTDEDRALRPLSFSEFHGQTTNKQNLEVYVQAAKLRQEPLDHLLFAGPPGLGKTTLANIIANEMGSKLVVINAPTIKTKGELASALASLRKSDFLFLDEIHSLNPKIEEILYPAMEDFRLEVIAGNKPITINLEPFTLIGATTRSGMIQRPLRDRFGVVIEMQPYSVEELAIIIRRSVQKLGLQYTDEGVLELSRRSRGTPRIANRLLRRIRDFIQFTNGFLVSEEAVRYTCDRLGIDSLGLDLTSQKYLSILVSKQIPLSLNTMVALLGESKDTVEEVIEPELLSLGLIEKTAKGRQITAAGFQHLKING